MSTETIQKFCCWHWKQLIEGKDLKTKYQEFAANETMLKSEFYKIHPMFIRWIKHPKDPMRSGYHWFHFCPNCGTQKDSNENIQKWFEYWNKPTT